MNDILKVMKKYFLMTKNYMKYMKLKNRVLITKF